MSIENIYNSEPTMDDIYAWHKEEASQSLGLTTLLSWPKGLVHLTGAALLWFPVVNRIVYAVSKGCFQHQPTPSENGLDKKPIVHYLMPPVLIEKLNNLESALYEKIIGQDKAIQIVCNAIRRAALRLKGKRTQGSFLFLGPTGVGKTELAKTISENWLCNNKTLHRFDMSEYKMIFTLSNLIGSAPGLMGSWNGGALTNALKKNPHGVFLFDEVEKAHPEILDIMLQMFDAGRITDGTGNTIDCSKAIFIMTSNIGGDAYHLPKEERQPALDQKLKEALRPEFINRIDEIIFFNSLDQNDIFKKIVESKIDIFKREMEACLLNRVTISWDEEVIE